jgi:Uma2 family endonuclease
MLPNFGIMVSRLAEVIMAGVSTPQGPPLSARQIVQSASNGLCIRIPRTAHTLAGFRDWVKSPDFPEKLRVAYVDQEILLDMSKEEEHHALAKAEICRVQMNLNHELDLGEFLLDGVLITNEAAGVSNNPDAALLLYTSMEAGRVRWVAGTRGRQKVEVVGTPDWVLEIVSDSSVRKDTLQLRAAYHRAGIPEYWLVDARGQDILFQILHWRKSGYVCAPSKGGWQRSRVFGHSFRLERRRNAKGFWKYTLHVRPA